MRPSSRTTPKQNTSVWEQSISCTVSFQIHHCRIGHGKHKRLYTLMFTHRGDSQPFITSIPALTAITKCRYNNHKQQYPMHSWAHHDPRPRCAPCYIHTPEPCSSLDWVQAKKTVNSFHPTCRQRTSRGKHRTLHSAVFLQQLVHQNVELDKPDSKTRNGDVLGCNCVEVTKDL